MSQMLEGGRFVTYTPTLSREQVLNDLEQALHWLTHTPYTQEQALARDELIVRLRQDHYHVDRGLVKP